MRGASLLLVCNLLAQSPSAPSPQSLVDQLGSVKYADREAAARAIEELGREALPALQAARDSRDMEIHTRAAALFQKIEGSLLTEPTRVGLSFQDEPLLDVVKTLSQRSGMKIALFPENLPRWKTERLTLAESQPLPFWKAVDRLCGGARPAGRPRAARLLESDRAHARAHRPGGPADPAGLRSRAVPRRPRRVGIPAPRGIRSRAAVARQGRPASRTRQDHAPAAPCRDKCSVLGAAPGPGGAAVVAHASRAVADHRGP